MVDAVDAAQVSLDRKRWTALWLRLGAQGPGVDTFAQLNLAYGDPARTYHTAEHIRDCLAELDRARGLAVQPDEVEAALWFHDAVYDARAPDNEEQSARQAQAALTAAGVSIGRARHIADLILATKHVALAGPGDAQLLCDIDLSILGRSPEAFAEFERRIRQEYAWVPEPTYRTSRSEILAGFLRRRTIYQTDYFRDRYEAPARQNLHRLIKRLRS
jgi:predicted metal-dependent HD superfamily phosphohydrolase